MSLAQLTNVCCLDVWHKHGPNIKSCTVLTLCSTHLYIIITKFYRPLKYNKRFAEPTVMKFYGRVKCPCWLSSGECRRWCHIMAGSCAEASWLHLEAEKRKRDDNQDGTVPSQGHILNVISGLLFGSPLKGLSPPWSNSLGKCL